MVFLKKSTGFTLIELIVGLGLLLFLMLKTLPVASQWQQSIAINKAQAQIQLAVSIAKAHSQKNKYQTSLADSSAVICVADGTLEVRAATPTAEAGCTSNNELVWSNTIKSNTTISVVVNTEEVLLQCMCFRPSGLSRVGGASCDDCQKSTLFVVSVGGVSERFRIT